MITGEFINCFIYEEDAIADDIMNCKLVDLECKHVVSVLASQVYNASVKAGYTNVVLGSHRRGTLESENHIISEMATNDSFNRPVRVVLAKDDRLWCDNTHSTIAYLRRYGEEAHLSDIPFYLVDIRKKVPVVFSVRGSVVPHICDIKNAIACSLRINERLDLGIRPDTRTWTVGDLKREIELLVSLI